MFLLQQTSLKPKQSSPDTLPPASLHSISEIQKFPKSSQSSEGSSPPIDFGQREYNKNPVLAILPEFQHPSLSCISPSQFNALSFSSKVSEVDNKAIAVS